MAAKKQPQNQHLTTAIAKEIVGFIVDRTSSQLSKNTISYYQHELDWFQTWLLDQSITRMDQITPDIIRKYFIRLAETRTPGGIHATWRALRAWLNWYAKELDDPGYKNPIDKVNPPKISKEPLPGIPMESIKLLLATCNVKTEIGKRDRAIFIVLVDSGLRKEELVALNMQDVNMRTGAVAVLHGKGDKARTVFLGATARRELQRYLRLRPDAQPEEPLFLNQNGTRLTGSGLRQVVRRRAIEANIEEPGLHDFRRTFALESLRNGIDLVTLMHLMGHTDTIVLQRYLKLIETDLRRGHERASPADML